MIEKAFVSIPHKVVALACRFEFNSKMSFPCRWTIVCEAGRQRCLSTKSKLLLWIERRRKLLIHVVEIITFGDDHAVAWKGEGWRLKEISFGIVDCKVSRNFIIFIKSLWLAISKIRKTRKP